MQMIPPAFIYEIMLTYCMEYIRYKFILIFFSLTSVIAVLLIMLLKGAMLIYLPSFHKFNLRVSINKTELA